MESRFAQQQLRTILVLAAITFAPRILLATLTYGAGLVDIRNYEIVGNAVLEGRTAYDLELRLYPYPPPWMYVEAATLGIARNTGISFDFAIKLPLIISDAIITYMVFHFLERRGISTRNAFLWALAFALNPVAIMVSAGHGQFDSIVILFVLLSIYFVVDHNDSFFAALLLGLGVALKLYPILVLPVLLVYRYHQTRSLRQCLAFGVLSVIPLVMVLIPFAIVGQRKAFLWPLEYPLLGGVSDFGIVRVLSYFNVSAPYLRDISKIVFLLGYMGVLLIMYPGSQMKAITDNSTPFHPVNSADACQKNSMHLNPFSYERDWVLAALVAMFLMFYATVGVISAQYYFWIIPFAAAIRARNLFPYSIASSFALLCFYVAKHPAGIAGPHTLPDFLRTIAHQVLPFSVTFSWSVSFIWMTMFIIQRVRAKPLVIRKLIQTQCGYKHNA